MHDIIDDRKLDLPSEEIKRRMLEKAALVAMLEARNGRPPTPVANETEPPLQVSLTGRITADGRKLAGLMSRAKKLETVAEALGEKANAARQDARSARAELNDYMTQNGLA
jgi:hypothetical protein